MPSSNRLRASMPKPVASPWPAQASDQNSMIATKPILVPSTSISLPPPAYITAYATRNDDCSNENCSLLIGMS
jgi:hypothetical protein